jgi:hypothetical protein
MVHGPVGHESVWVFVGAGARLPSAVFSSQAEAEEWIKANRLEGLLTEYPLNQSAYDWAVAQGYFKPSKPEHSTPKFIGGFTSASQRHIHYEASNGTSEE